MPIKWNEVTWYSKLLAAVLILAAFGVGLYIGGQNKGASLLPPDDGGVVCTADAFQCSDGSWVGRSGPDCKFVCPTPTEGGNDAGAPDIPEGVEPQ